MLKHARRVIFNAQLVYLSRNMGTSVSESAYPSRNELVFGALTAQRATFSQSIE
jgi:hypothetical protein